MTPHFAAPSPLGPSERPPVLADRPRFALRATVRPPAGHGVGGARNPGSLEARRLASGENEYPADLS